MKFTFLHTTKIWRFCGKTTESISYLVIVGEGINRLFNLILLKMKKFFETKKALAERLEYLRLLKGALVATGKGAKVGAVVTAEKSRIREEIK